MLLTMMCVQAPMMDVSSENWLEMMQGVFRFCGDGFRHNTHLADHPRASNSDLIEDNRHRGCSGL